MSAGPTQRTPTAERDLAVDGAVALERRWTWDEIPVPEPEDVTCDIHCVTTWSTRPPAARWAGCARRVDDRMLAETAWPRGAGRAAHMCGPTPFVERVADLLVSRGPTRRSVRNASARPATSEARSPAAARSAPARAGGAAERISSCAP